MIYQIVVSFLSMMVLDLIWVKYTRSVVQKQPLWAGIWAVGIALCVGVVTLSYVENPWMLAPTMAGAFSGTYIATKWAA